MRKWNRQQGLYTYRAGRLVQWGGWFDIQASTNAPNSARAGVDFDTDLDSAFNINVIKMRVSIPAQLRQMIERPINEMCSIADEVYRKAAGSKPPEEEENGSDQLTQASEIDAHLQTPHWSQVSTRLSRIASVLRKSDPDVTAALGI